MRHLAWTRAARKIARVLRPGMRTPPACERPRPEIQSLEYRRSFRSGGCMLEIGARTFEQTAPTQNRTLAPDPPLPSFGHWFRSERQPLSGGLNRRDFDLRQTALRSLAVEVGVLFHMRDGHIRRLNYSIRTPGRPPLQRPFVDSRTDRRSTRCVHVWPSTMVRTRATSACAT